MTGCFISVSRISFITHYINLQIILSILSYFITIPNRYFLMIILSQPNWLDTALVPLVTSLMRCIFNWPTALGCLMPFQRSFFRESPLTNATDIDKIARMCALVLQQFVRARKILWTHVALVSSFSFMAHHVPFQALRWIEPLITLLAWKSSDHRMASHMFTKVRTSKRAATYFTLARLLAGMAGQVLREITALIECPAANVTGVWPRIGLVAGHVLH